MICCCGDSSGGDRTFVPTLANCAVSAGAKCLFFETHPNPESALCDGANMIALDNMEKVLDNCNKIFKLVQNF